MFILCLCQASTSVCTQLTPVDVSSMDLNTLVNGMLGMGNQTMTSNILHRKGQKNLNVFLGAIKMHEIPQG